MNEVALNVAFDSFLIHVSYNTHRFWYELSSEHAMLSQLRMISFKTICSNIMMLGSPYNIICSEGSVFEVTQCSSRIYRDGVVRG